MIYVAILPIVFPVHLRKHFIFKVVHLWGLLYFSSDSFFIKFSYGFPHTLELIYDMAANNSHTQVPSTKRSSYENQFIGWENIVRRLLTPGTSDQ
jgi:hypothetical protein